MKRKKLANRALLISVTILISLLLPLTAQGETALYTPWRNYTQTGSTTERAEWRVVYNNTACSSCTITAPEGVLYLAPSTDCTAMWHTGTNTVTLHWSQQQAEWMMCFIPNQAEAQSILFTYHAADGSVIHQDVVKLFRRADESWAAVMDALPRDGSTP